jgi:hypothetical protein
MKFRADNLNAAYGFDGSLNITLTAHPDGAEAVAEAYNDLRNQPVTVEIKKWSKKRSLEANAFLWELCGKIASVLKSTKEEVYRELVRRVGVCEYIPIQTDLVSAHAERWERLGVGWFCEDLGASRTLDGFNTVRRYYGSSTYDVQEMNRLIDEAVSEAEGQGIPTLKDDVTEVKENWRKAAERKH